MLKPVLAASTCKEADSLSSELLERATGQVHSEDIHLARDPDCGLLLRHSRKWRRGSWGGCRSHRRARPTALPSILALWHCHSHALQLY